MPYRRYSREFREQACGLVMCEGYGVIEASRKLGVAEPTLRQWLGKLNWTPPSMPKALPPSDSDDPKVLKARIRDLESRLRRAEMEREILKKATAYFASPHLPGSGGSADTEGSSK